MDNPYKNWRNYVLWALFVCGLLSMLFAMGTPDNDITCSAFLWHFTKYASLSVVFFSAMGALKEKWERERKISGF